jgi:hypothetical protein
MQGGMDIKSMFTPAVPASGAKAPAVRGVPAAPARVAEASSKATANLKALADNLGLSEEELLTKLGAGANFHSLLGASSANPYAAAYSPVGGVRLDVYA